MAFKRGNSRAAGQPAALVLAANEVPRLSRPAKCAVYSAQFFSPILRTYEGLIQETTTMQALGPIRDQESFAAYGDNV